VTAHREQSLYGRVSFIFSFLEINMRRILIGSVAIASLLAATGVFAADLPARTYTKAPVTVDPGYN
jgi:hypothetical protein